MKTISKMIAEELAISKADLHSHFLVLELLKKVEGKQFNLRTFNKKLLGEQFEFNGANGMFHIIEKTRNTKHLIGYSTTHGVDSSTFYELDICYARGSEERINNLENIDVKKLVKMQRLLSKHFNAIREIFGAIESNDLGSFDNPIYYRILDSIYDNKSNNRDINLNDFHYIRTHSKKDVL